MTNETDLPPDGGAKSIDWEKIRARYEKGEEQVKAIAAQFGMAGVTLSLKAKALGWTLRGAPRKVASVVATLRKSSKGESTAETIRRLKELLNTRIANLESEIQQIGKEIDQISNEKQIRSVNMMVRTLEKVLDLERKDKDSKRRTKAAFKLFDESQRGALAEKIERLEEGWQGETTVGSTGDAGSGGTEPSVALLGAAGATAAT